MSSLRPSRREFLQIALAAPALVRLQGQPTVSVDPWQNTAAILARIREPAFPNRDVDATRYSLDQRRDRRVQHGRRRARRRAGRTFTTGPIRLKSRVNLHLSEGAVAQVLPRTRRTICRCVYTRFEGTELMNYSPFIYAFEQSRTSPSPAPARSTARPTRRTGGSGPRSAGRRRAAG